MLYKTKYTRTQINATNQTKRANLNKRLRLETCLYYSVQRTILFY